MPSRQFVFGALDLLQERSAVEVGVGLPGDNARKLVELAFQRGIRHTGASALQLFEEVLRPLLGLGTLPYLTAITRVNVSNRAPASARMTIHTHSSSLVTV